MQSIRSTEYSISTFYILYIAALGLQATWVDSRGDKGVNMAAG